MLRFRFCHFFSGFWSLYLILIAGNISLAQEASVYNTKDSLQLASLDAAIEKMENSGMVDSLMHYYRQKVELHRQKDDLFSWWDTYWYFQQYFDDSQRALEVIEESIQQAWRQAGTYEEWEALLWIYASKGYHHFELGQVLDAIQALEEADAIFTTYQINDFDVLDYVYKPLGTYLTMIGDNEKARYIYEKALQQTESNESIGGIYNNIGISYWNDGDNQQAIAEYRKGLVIKDLSPARRGQLLSNLAQSLQELQQAEAALSTAQEAVSMLTNLDDPEHPDFNSWLSGAYYHYGSVLASQLRDTEAKAAFEQALQFSVLAYGTRNHRNSGKILIALGQLAVKSSQFEEAINYFNEALSSVIPSFQPAHFTENPSAEFFHEENAISEALAGKANVLHQYYALKKDQRLLKASLDCHELAYSAEKALRKVLENESAKLLLQSQRRIRTEQALEVAHLLYQLTNEIAYLEKAFLIAERSKASLLLENIQENLVKRAIAGGDSLFQAESELMRYYSWYEKEHLLAEDEAGKKRFLFEKNKIGEQLSEIRKQIQQQFPALTSVSEKELDFQQIEQWFTKTETEILLEYFVGDERIYMFSLQPGKSVSLHTIENDTSISRLIQSFAERFYSREQMSNEREDYFKEAELLYAMLCKPAIGDKKASIGIIPDGLLNYIPFEALLYESYTGNWSRAPFLLRRNRISYGYSVSTLFFLDTLTNTADKNLLAMAPGFSEGERGLPPLSFSQEELAAIDVPSQKLLVNNAASLQEFRRQSPDYQILHLSTHAQGGSNGIIPHIEFFDSTLYLPEIYAMHLQADLVTLSACETGLGQLAMGEGVMSLSRGFTFAGAASLIASLWTVNEASTARLFADFYQHLSAGTPKVQALQEAKLAYLNATEIPDFQKSPYYWAGFVYYGNEGGIPLKESAGIWQWGIWGMIGMVIILWFFLRRR